MRNDQDSKALPRRDQPLHGPSNDLSVIRIQAGRGFIQDKKLWLSHQRPCNYQPLRLSPRHTGPAVAYQGEVALGQGCDEVVDPGCFCCGADVEHCAEWGVVFEAVADVVGYCAGEDGGSLGDDGDEGAEGWGVDALEVDSV